MAAFIGIENLVAAKFNEEEGTYDTPRVLTPLTNIGVTPNTDSVTLYGDNRAVAVAESLGDIDIEVGVTELTDADYAFLLGKSINGDGAIEDSVDDIAPYVALGFASTKSNGAKRLSWYYKGKFLTPAETLATKGESTEFQTPVISGKFMAREDGKWRATIDTDSKEVSQEVVDTWFDEVYEPTPEV